ncbi:hypothetical protein [Amycolatopsis aidingensis]|uniref:hypothetical protein n=1 Tax=Amycolatopsis aidingensis TaxID=2842453 RepID=UPI001E44E4DF|nr:hypothetical protein [Amycolatopsis aidingensis]
MAFNARWSPGPDAVAGMHTTGSGPHQAGLVMYLDPDSLAILPPPDPAEWPGFVRLLRQLSGGAKDLAALLENTGKEVITMGVRLGRSAVAPQNTDEAHKLICEAMPPGDADLSVWLTFYRQCAAVYDSLGESGKYWRDKELAKAKLCEQRMTQAREQQNSPD